MNRFNQFLALVLGLELAISGYVWYRNHSLTVAPVPSFAVFDSITANDFQNLADDCSSAEQWHALANIYMSAGFFAEADACFGQALKMKPGWGEAMYDHAFCLSRYGKTQKANEQFEKVIELLHPKAGNAAYFIGRNHLRDENPDLAEKAFRQASELPMAHFELARLYFRQGKFEEAESQLEKVLAKQPDASRAKLLLAEIASAQNKTTRAISFSADGSEQTARIESPFKIEKDRLMQSVSKYGVEKEIARNMDLLYRKKFDESRTGLEMLQTVEWTPHVQEALVKIAMESNDLRKAEQLIEEEISRSGPTTVWLGNLGDVRMRLGDTSGAVEAWTKGTQVRNDITVGNCYRGLGQYYESVGDTDRADEFQFKLLLDLAGKSITEGRSQQAIDFLTEASAVYSDSAEVHYLFGKAYRIAFAPDKAAAAYKKCIEIDPTNGKAIRELKLVQSMQQ